MNWCSLTHNDERGIKREAEFHAFPAKAPNPTARPGSDKEASLNMQTPDERRRQDDLHAHADTFYVAKHKEDSLLAVTAFLASCTECNGDIGIHCEVQKFRG